MQYKYSILKNIRNSIRRVNVVKQIIICGMEKTIRQDLEKSIDTILSFITLNYQNSQPYSPVTIIIS